uniref:LLM class F420-dependent oxidoreductase n=1 Tax=Thermogemmatispora argillosa TaxID=2045280 RepID=A0A455T4G8_9CHLR|nr:LLM class F420-dependent oxidoreductase [Thermogemmatispora argillosa]
MVAISIQIEGQTGLTWSRWKRLVEAIEGLGYAGLFRSDHFTDPVPPDREALETIVSLAYAADHTQRVHFGPLVSPISFHHPVMLTRQAIALDDLSGGRFIFGVGAGWQEREHAMFGLNLGDMRTRMARFAEALEVINLLLRSEQPVTFQGQFYQLREAQLLPRPQRPGGPPIMIGGGGRKRTLPLAARYADIWNAGFLTPEQFRDLSAFLDQLLQEAGRPPASVQRTMMTSLFFGRTREDLYQRLDWWRHYDPSYAPLSSQEILDRVLAQNRTIVGTPDMAIAQIRRYGEAGVQELMLQWFYLDDIDGLRDFAETVLPHV